MKAISVYKPVVPAVAEEKTLYAPRREPRKATRLCLIDNGKPNARQLLLAIGSELKDSLSLTEITVHSKPSAGYPISPDEARMMAAGHHLAITGLGD